MDKEIERVRPEYLEPIGKKRSGFPWLLLIGVAVAVLAVLGVHQHMQTRAAWEARFNKEPQKAQEVPTTENEREARLAAIREQREMAEERYIREQLDKAAREKEAGNIKCIHGTAFRRIPGGWENIPNMRCSK